MAQTARRKAPASKAPTAVAEEVVEVVPPENPPTKPRRIPAWVSPAVAGLLILVGLVQLMTLGRQEDGGPPHFGISMGDGVPATLYLPGEKPKGGEVLEPKPIGQRPALVIMAHGYSADMESLSTMARSVARSGYATLTIDFRGHGSNPHHFNGNIDEDLNTAITWAQTSPWVDPSRIALLGHSMGASAALDWATLDKRVAAVIPVSGGNAPTDAYTPPHVLFIVASRDPGVIHDSQEAAAATLQSRPGVDVQSVEVGGTDHLSVVADGRTFEAITGFLDNAFGTPTDRISTGRNDPRRATATGYAVVCVVLFGFLGRLVGRAVKPIEPTAQPGAWAVLAGASLVTLPLLATGGFWILPIGAGQQVAVAWLFAAAVLWGTRYFARTGVLTGPVAGWFGDSVWLPLRTVGVPGVLAGVAMFVMLAPAGVILHNAVPSAERVFYWAILAAATLPFMAAFEAIVRRGSTWRALGFGLLGRALLIVVLLVGLALGALPFVLSLVVPVLAIQYLVLEVFATAAWSTGRNAAVIAVAESVFIAWFAVMFSPIG